MPYTFQFGLRYPTDLGPNLRLQVTAICSFMNVDFLIIKHNT